ncbi:hypothetical protein FEK35_11930 [Nocardia cyriacigeorgica]|uniref:PPE domain-containing protein n=1 Tax=Nocardia cyriacigeorgica TaxID=135487 RepID=A0A5R8PEW3_9NOCA|nr:hypothetical protein [Nocardia cyriacigeorgica]TLG12206.1 hypothetical protein FEK35_11930 [Nocardia cyriacigeorgica]
MSEIQNELPRIKDGENPDHLEHAQINAAFTPLNTTEAFAAANKFTEIENKWTDGVRVFAARIQRSSSAAWDGPAAEAARSALSNYTTRAQDLSPVLQALGSRVYGAVDSINSTKRELPEVVEKGKTWTPANLPGPAAIARAVRDDAEATAREVMGTHYVKPFVKADSEIPVLPKPDDPTQPLVPPVKPPTEGREWEGGGGDTGGDNGGGNGGGDQGGPGEDQGGGEGEPEETTGGEETGGETPEEQQDPTTTAANTTTPSSTPTSTTSRLTDPSLTSTTPAGVNAAGYSPTGVPGGGTGGSAGTGGLGRGGGAGSSGGSGSGGSGSGSEKPGAGRSIPGGPGGIAAQTGAGAAAAARAAAAGRGMMGMPMGGMAPGAGRGGNAEENEHKTPDYLVTAENTDALLGEVPKTVPGGVIGGDVPSAAPVREQDGEDRR